MGIKELEIYKIMLNNLKQFFSDIAEKDEVTKKKWLIFLTSVSMLIVTALWGVYINLTVKNLYEDKEIAEKTGFFAVLKNGTGIVSEEAGLRVSRLAAAVKQISKRTNSITIDNAGNRFLMKKDLEKINPVQLP